MIPSNRPRTSKPAPAGLQAGLPHPASGPPSACGYGAHTVWRTRTPEPDSTDVDTAHSKGANAGSAYVGGADTDLIASEVPVALEFNGISHATLLATPCNLEDFAYGFSYTEGIVRSAGDIYGVDIVEKPSGIVVQLEIASACLHELKLRRRSLAGRTGCGLCGLESLDEVRRDLPALPTPAAGYPPDAIVRAASELLSMQALHQATGATHAAGWANLEGAVLEVREDVGRHNALDKLIGHMLRKAISPRDGLAMISSRASFEMVQKAAAAGIGALVAVSAPTSYAVHVAQDLNVLLAGFARGGNFTVYSHPEYLGRVSPRSQP